MKSAVDTNMISAIWTAQPNHVEAKTLLGESLKRGRLVISGIVYAELLAHPLMTSRGLDAFLEATGVELEHNLNKTVWQEAGIRFRNYAERRRRARQEWPRRLMADFVIGAHALLLADRLITFNGADFRRDFPELLIAPEPLQ